MFMTNTFLFLKTLRLEAGARAVSVVPNAARLLRHRRIAAQPASVTLGSAAADLSRTRVILAGHREITIAGSATLNRQLLLSAAPAPINLATSEAIMQRTRLAGFIKADITIEPQPARMLRNLALKCEPASIELTPNSANFLKVLGTIEAQPQTVTIEARAADLRASRVFTGAPTVVEVTSLSALLRRTYPLFAQPKGIAVAPRPATLRLSRVLKAVKQDIAISPKAANLTHVVPPPASQQYVGWTEVLATTSSWNFTNVNIGSPSADRYVIMVLFFSGGPAAAASTVSVNGVALTSLGGISGAAIYSGLVPTGTLVNVNIGSNVNGDRCGFAIFSAIGLRNGGAVSDIKTSNSTAASVTLNTNVPAEGICIAGRKSNFAHSSTWNNITERVDETIGQPTYTAASIDVPAGNSALAVNCVFSGTADAPGFVSASFR